MAGVGFMGAFGALQATKSSAAEEGSLGEGEEVTKDALSEGGSMPTRDDMKEARQGAPVLRYSPFAWTSASVPLAVSPVRH